MFSLRSLRFTTGAVFQHEAAAKRPREIQTTIMLIIPGFISTIHKQSTVSWGRWNFMPRGNKDQVNPYFRQRSFKSPKVMWCNSQFPNFTIGLMILYPQQSKKSTARNRFTQSIRNFERPGVKSNAGTSAVVRKNMTWLISFSEMMAVRWYYLFAKYICLTKDMNVSLTGSDLWMWQSITDKTAPV